MNTYEVAFLINGVKHTVPVSASGYEVTTDGHLQLHQLDDEDMVPTCTFKEWLYVVRVCTARGVPTAYFNQSEKFKELAQSVKSAQHKITS